MTPIRKTFAGSMGMAWIALLVFAILGVASDIIHTFEQGGIDFRNRLIGARLLLAGKDPYFYKWKEGDPVEWLDPRDSPRMPVNRNTVSPACLLVYAPLAPLTYTQARIGWLLVQWAAYAGLAALLVTAAAKGRDRQAILVLFLLAFAGEAWRVHVERGQVYILYALLLGAGYRITRAGKPTLGGAVLGLLIGLRPTLLVTVIPFALWRRWWFLTGTAGGVAAALLASFVLADKDDWASYFRAMDTILTASVAGKDARDNSREPAPAIPDSIEGWTNLSSAIRFAHPQTGYARIVRFSGLPQGKRWLQAAMLLYVGLVGFGVYHRWKPPIPPGSMFLIGTAMAVSYELFLPAHRGGYSNVMWLAPAAMLVAEAGVGRLAGSRLVWLLIVGLALALGVIPAARGDHVSLSDTLLIIYFAAVMLNPWNRSQGSGTSFGVNVSANGGELPPKNEPDPGV